MLTISESPRDIYGMFIILISQFFCRYEMSKIKSYPIKNRISKQHKISFREIKSPKSISLRKYLGLKI